MRVLIADDNREIRSALRLALLEVSSQAARTHDAARDAPWEAAQGAEWDTGEQSATTPCTILEAGNANEALVVLQSQNIDILLLDWELPGLDAQRTLPQMRSCAPACTVIAMSACPETRDRSLQAGADHFVGRSDPPGRLLELLRGLWTSSRAQAS